MSRDPRAAMQGLAAARAALSASVSERDFQAAVVEMADVFGWLGYHTYRSDRSAPGYPDLTLVRPPRLLFAELKTETGRLSPAQRQWIDALGRCDTVETHLWLPSGMVDVEHILR